MPAPRGGGWTTTHLMASDGNGGEPGTVPVGTEGYGWDGVGAPLEITD